MNRFAKFSWGVLVYILMVILWGAVVRATGSGAGCGSHWPLCNGEIIPRPDRLDTIIEFSHRISSGLSILLIGAMVIWGWQLFGKGHIVRKGLVASGIFIVLEALIGAGLVLFKWVGSDDSVGRAFGIAFHLLNTFLLLGSVTLTAHWAGGGKSWTASNRQITPVIIGLFGIALIGMSGAITALGDTLFPVETLAEGLSQDRNPGAHFLIRLRIYHPLIAILVGFYTIALMMVLYRSILDPITRRLSFTLAGLVILQWAVGVLNILLLVPVWLQLIHLFLADLIWIAYVLLTVAIPPPKLTSHKMEGV